MQYTFDKDGNGKAVIKQQNGTKCEASVKRINGIRRVYKLITKAPLFASDKTVFNMPKIKCKAGINGNSDCSAVYGDGQDPESKKNQYRTAQVILLALKTSEKLMILKKTLIATISALLLCGCANSYLGFGSKGDVDPALEESGAKFFSESGFTSCLAGAGIRVAACAAADSDNMLACMLIAGFSGCAVGMTTNYVFDSVRSNYAKTEDQLDAIEKMVSQKMLMLLRM